MNTITKGSTGTDVKILQACFRMLQMTDGNYKPIEITGRCDTSLVQAINKFQMIQAAYGYDCGNGDSSFGPKCWARLLGV